MVELLSYPPGPEVPFTSKRMHLQDKSRKHCVAIEVLISGAATLTVLEFARRDSEEGFPLSMCSTEKPTVGIRTIRDSGIYQAELGPVDAVAVSLETYTNGEVTVHARYCTA